MGGAAGIIGGRIYFDVTTPADVPHVWYGVFAVWTGGWASGAAWRWRPSSAYGGGGGTGITAGAFANAVAPALLVAQAIGQIGNYFNKSCSAGRRRFRGAWRSRPRRQAAAITMLRGVPKLCR